MYDVKKFVANLKKSTFSPQAQKALIQLLPTLKKVEILRLAQILQEDVQKQENVFKKAQLKAKIILADFKREVKKLAEML